MEIHSTISSTFYSPRTPTPARTTAGAAETGASAATAPNDTPTAAGVEEGDGATTSRVEAIEELSEEELAQLQTLKSRDAEVRAHEQAHMAAGGRYITSGASYEYQRGPDGQDYAIGGEVGIDTSPVSGDPAATIAKARTLIRAALAPAEPSSQDQRVAAAAKSMESAALQELVELQLDEQTSASARPAGGTSGPNGARGGADSSGDTASATSSPSERLEQRIAGFFAVRVQHAISQFA